MATREYSLFRSWAPLRKMDIPDDTKPGRFVTWEYYDYGGGDDSETYPVVILPGLCTTPNTFYQQFVGLCPKGYRLIAVEPTKVTLPNYDIWLSAFNKFMDKLKVTKMHILGVHLGGLLGQLYAYKYPEKVDSLILVNAFSSTQYFVDHSPCRNMILFMPEFLLKRNILSTLPKDNLPPVVAEAIDFVATEVEAMELRELNTKLLLNCSISAHVNKENIFDAARVMVIAPSENDPYCSIPLEVRNQIKSLYPESSYVELRGSGGDFLQLTRFEDVNMYIQVHLRRMVALDNSKNDDENENNKDNKEEEETK